MKIYYTIEFNTEFGVNIMTYSSDPQYVNDETCPDDMNKIDKILHFMGNTHYCENMCELHTSENDICKALVAHGYNPIRIKEFPDC